MEPLDGKCILELGCGNGELWNANRDRIPADASICLSDISEGMIRDVEENLKSVPGSFTFEVFDCRQIPKPEESFHIVAANHLLFYLSNLDGVLDQVQRILKPEGVFLLQHLRFGPYEGDQPISKGIRFQDRSFRSKFIRCVRT
uniref:class I SAM-dependent methyltransferase n=1 Tax=Clostridium sp. NkU-1 TaxID=1095009 RepID=UPI003260634D